MIYRVLDRCLENLAPYAPSMIARGEKCTRTASGDGLKITLRDMNMQNETHYSPELE